MCALNLCVFECVCVCVIVVTGDVIEVFMASYVMWEKFGAIL